MAEIDGFWGEGCYGEGYWGEGYWGEYVTPAPPRIRSLTFDKYPIIRRKPLKHLFEDYKFVSLFIEFLEMD